MSINQQGNKGLLSTKFLITALGMILLSIGFFVGKIDTTMWVGGLLGMVGGYEVSNVGLTAMFRKQNNKPPAPGG